MLCAGSSDPALAEGEEQSGKQDLLLQSLAERACFYMEMELQITSVLHP